MAPKRKAPATAREPTNEKKSKKKVKGGVLEAGDELPDVGSLEFDESTPESVQELNLKDVLKDSGAVLFFYPKANTGGCTKQAKGFNENREKLAEAGYRVFGMSADRPRSQANWKRKYNMQLPLLSDPSRQAQKTFGLLKSVRSIYRSLIIVEKGGDIKYIKVGIGPEESVKEALKICNVK